MRLLACSDVHLDAPFAWAGPELGARRRRSLRESFGRIVGLVDELRAEALLVAGDLYEHELCTPDTVRFVARLLGEIDPVPVLLAPGNHDPLVADSLYRRADFTPNVVVFDQPCLLPHRLAPGLTVWGAAHLAPAGTGNFLEDFTVDGSGVHLGLFHGSERRGFAAQGSSKVMHAPFDADEILASGLDHAVVGHYHLRREAPHHTYPGNPFPLGFGDGQGGAVEIEVADDGSLTRRWHEVCDSPAHEIEIDVSGWGDADELAAAVGQRLAGLEGVARLCLTGELHPELDLSAAGLERSWPGLDGVLVRTDKVRLGYDIEALAAESSVRGLFVRAVLDDPALDDDERQRVLITGLRALEGRRDLGPLAAAGGVHR